MSGFGSNFFGESIKPFAWLGVLFYTGDIEGSGILPLAHNVLGFATRTTILT